MPVGKSPEELELIKKQHELSLLEASLAQRELDLATLQAELNSFEESYIRIVVVKLVQLDEIEAKILEAKARLKPEDSRIQEEAIKSRMRANESATAIETEKKSVGKEFKPSENLKKLFREVAKSIHPDLAVDSIEVLHRQKLMAEANSAYKEGNEARLLAILEEWKNSPESVKGEGTAVDLVRAIRKISKVKIRLNAIDNELSKLMETDLYKLKIRSEKAHAEGRNLLAEISFNLEEKIILANKRLNKFS